ncbi:MAG: outer membrane lipid asymmetry maintenance protein MlaD [Pseudomonadota bacterium]
MKRYHIEIMVGFFMLLGFLALIMLALKVSGLSNYMGNNGFVVTANFNNIGDLKIRAPVTVAGVRVGRVEAIQLNPKTYQASVTLFINKSYNDLPKDTSASILTQGILGSNYISLTPGYDTATLKNGSVINHTHPALILENLIGQLLFKVNGGNNQKKSESQIKT